MFVEASAPRKRGDKARLIGPHFPPTTGKCLRFFYHMYGSGTGTLAVYLRHYNMLGRAAWKQSGNQGNTWLPAQVNLNSNSPFDVCVFKNILLFHYYYYFNVFNKALNTFLLIC